jgi:hypothetical protein
MAILISPLVLLFDTTITNPRTTPSISNMLSHAALRGGIKESNGPEKVIENALLNIIFSVSQTGSISQEDLDAFHSAWGVALPYIPLPPPNDPSGEDMEIDETQASMPPPNDSSGENMEVDDSILTGGGQGSTQPTSKAPVAAARLTAPSHSASRAPTTPRKKRVSTPYPSSSSRRVKQQTSTGWSEPIQEIPVTKEETINFTVSEDVASFPALSAVTSLYTGSDIVANFDMVADASEPTSKVSRFSTCVKTIADISVDPLLHGAVRHRHR